MSEWISVLDETPPNSNRGIWDSVNYLCLLSQGDMAVILWMSNSFTGFPAGATHVTHWMPLPESPWQES